MEFEKIKELMSTLNNSNLMDFELKLEDGFYIRMNKYEKPAKTENRIINNNYDVEENKKNINLIDEKKSNLKNNIIRDTEENFSEQNKKEDIKKDGNFITSPIVGTFYSSNSPTAQAFVKVGDLVSKGDLVCIVEAMKVMNEIKSSISGRVEEILVENEDMVEYNQPLFKII